MHIRNKVPSEFTGCYIFFTDGITQPNWITYFDEQLCEIKSNILWLRTFNLYFNYGAPSNTNSNFNATFYKLLTWFYENNISIEYITLYQHFQRNDT